MDKMEKATEKKKGFVKEFVDFLQTFGVIGLAIGFVIGVASSAVVNSLVKDMINPIVGLILPNWKPVIPECYCYFSSLWQAIGVSVRRFHLSDHILCNNRLSGFYHVQAVEAARARQDVETTRLVFYIAVRDMSGFRL